MVDITQQDLDVFVQFVYKCWSTAFDTLKRVKAEKFDGSQDWHLFHAERLKNALADEAKWKTIHLRLSLHSMRNVL